MTWPFETFHNQLTFQAHAWGGGSMAAPLAAAAPYIISAVGGLISGLFGGRSAKKEAKANRESQQYDFAAQRYFDDQRRKDALEARRYNEDAIAGYRGFTKRPDAPLPVMTDPNSIKPILPQHGRSFP